MSSLNALQIRRCLGRSNWSTPVPFGSDGWLFDQLDGRARVIATALHLFGRLDGRPVLPDFTYGAASI